MLGDRGWLEAVRIRYDFYVEQSALRERTPKPFEHFAQERLFEQFVTLARFLSVAREWGWLSRKNGLPAARGSFESKDLVRDLTVAGDLVQRALEALRKSDGGAARLIVRYVRENAWDYARFGFSKEEGQSRVEKGQRFLYEFLTETRVDAGVPKS